MKQDNFRALDSEEKLNEIFKSSEKMRKYFKWSAIATIVVIVIPLLFLPVLISKLVGIYDLGALGL